MNLVESKYTLSKIDDECNTRYLERDGFTLTCPCHIDFNEKNKPSNVYCGDWCPLFDIVMVLKSLDGVTPRVERFKVQLHCGSGNAEYSIDG